MQGLVTNPTAPLNTTDGASLAANGANGLNNSVNGVSSGGQGFSPLFANLMSAAAQSGQPSPFVESGLNLLSGQGLPQEGQLLPPGLALGLTNRSEQSRSTDNNGLQLASGHQRDEAGLPFSDLNPSAVAQSQLPVESARTALETARMNNGAAAIAAQVSGNGQGLGQQRIQQELLMRQLTTATLDQSDVDPLLQGQLASLDLDTVTANDRNSQLFGLMREAMLARQQTTALSSSGGETRIGESFSSALGALNTLSGDAKATAESRGLMQGSINTHFSQQADWGEEMASRVKWMVNSQVHSAELKMNPAQLGPIEVKISVVNDQTTVIFTAQNGAVREAIDSAIPRLREMLGDNGMNLVDVDVSDRESAQHEQMDAEDNELHDGQYAERDGDAGSPDTDSSGEESSSEGSVVLSPRTIDFYA